jgi:hypothetical protein
MHRPFKGNEDGSDSAAIASRVASSSSSSSSSVCSMFLWQSIYLEPIWSLPKHFIHLFAGTMKIIPGIVPRAGV